MQQRLRSWCWVYGTMGRHWAASGPRDNGADSAHWPVAVRRDVTADAGTMDTTQLNARSRDHLIDRAGPPSSLTLSLHDITEDFCKIIQLDQKYFLQFHRWLLCLLRRNISCMSVPWLHDTTTDNVTEVFCVGATLILCSFAILLQRNAALRFAELLIYYPHLRHNFITIDRFVTSPRVIALRFARTIVYHNIIYIN